MKFSIKDFFSKCDQSAVCVAVVEFILMGMPLYQKNCFFQAVLENFCPILLA